MLLEIDSRKRTITLHDELTIVEVAELHEALLSLAREDGPIEVDLSAVDRVDSAGIQVLLVASHFCKLTISGLSPTLNKRLHMIGVEHF